jgi:hypothetical protein
MTDPQLVQRGAVMGALMPNGSRPYSVQPEAEAVFRKHPESQLAHRERELERLARLLERQADSR